MSKKNAAQTLAAILTFLDLPESATEEDVSLAIAQREEAAKASGRTRVSVPKWTPTMLIDGEMKFSGTKIRLAADELEPLIQALADGDVEKFFDEHMEELKTRQEIREARKTRRAEAKAAKE